MATGRTATKYVRLYADGYDISGYSSTFGPLVCDAEDINLTAISDTVQGHLPGQVTQSVGTLNALFDNTSGGVHALMTGAGVQRTLLAAIGTRAVPAAGDSVFMTQQIQSGYTGEATGGAIAANVPFNVSSVAGATLLYANPWGVLVHANGAETGANAAAGIDLLTVSTAFGGYMTYQVLAAAGAGNMTATIGVDDSDASGGVYVNIVNTGVINCITPVAGIVAMTRAATVRQFVRWQLTLGTATSVTFVLGFHRATW